MVCRLATLGRCVIFRFRRILEVIPPLRWPFRSLIRPTMKCLAFSRAPGYGRKCENFSLRLVAELTRRNLNTTYLITI
jgi:hypothetical protein